MSKTIKDFKNQGEYLKYKSEVCYWRIKMLKQELLENQSSSFKASILSLITKYENEKMEIDSYLQNIQ